MGIIIPKKDVVVCFLLTRTHIWLGERKTEPWIGKWNGPGGKIEQGESPEEAQRREMVEEFKVIVETSSLKKFGKFNLARVDKPELNRILHIFITYEWSGEPSETKAMIPRLVLRTELPLYFGKMLPGDDELLSRILNGRKIIGSIIRKDEKGTLEDIKVEEVNEL